MGRVILDITVSLDGFVTAPGADLAHGLGVGGEPMHDWVVTPTDADRAALEGTAAAAGAVLMGRRTFDFIDGPHGWDAETGEDGSLPPIFVVTSHRPARTRLGDRFRFVTDGLEAALKLAQEAAGTKDVVIMGGGHLCRQYLYAGRTDEVRIHLAPIVLGDGTPLFERTTMPPIKLIHRATVTTPNATHLTYDVAA
ncbi:dihydrofolate reductase [Kribbella amoyensis]|uniref:Dihydrofolate reductase n=1 Tax=Kribbella amoyensis TaxID=996641 RepID=A0A561B925_9ACTN|nr:dihydrofolate reductase family protein [Kribbella amoyensis]TWD75360.1 dihydrofolate reductase [Kribbella amoyensis]